MDALKPSISLLCKLGSIAVHVDEMLSPMGHHFDKVALESVAHDPEVIEWMRGMRAMALLPEKR